VRWLAGASFTLYLMHEPLLACVRALAPVVRTNAAAALAATVFVFVLTLLLAEIGERRKAVYKRVIGAVVPFAALARRLTPARVTPPVGD
jgi:peptidoglycan/LPS O-acetylase OafA/YrhL